MRSLAHALGEAQGFLLTVVVHSAELRRRPGRLVKGLVQLGTATYGVEALFFGVRPRRWVVERTSRGSVRAAG
jgi:hypothetical protein